MDVTQLGVLATLIAGLVAAYLNFRKAPSEREALTVGTMGEVITALNAELARRDRRITEQDAKIEHQDLVIDGLRETIANMAARIATLEQAT